MEYSDAKRRAKRAGVKRNRIKGYLSFNNRSEGRVLYRNMSEDHLLAKEKGFRRLNKELEQKAQDLVKKIDRVINTYNGGSLAFDGRKNCANVARENRDDSGNVTLQNEHDSRLSVKRNSSLPHIFDQAAPLESKIQPRKDTEDELSKKTNLANKAILSTFQTKIDILRNELETLRIEYRKKCDACKDLEGEGKRVENKLRSEAESLKDTVAKLENTTRELQRESHALSVENSTLKRDLDKLGKEVKTSKQHANACVTRLNRCLESNEKLKNELKCCKIEEKELKVQIRKIQEDRRCTVDSLGKQLSELIQVLKKQMLVVDNLKKQNVRMFYPFYIDMYEQIRTATCAYFN